MNSFTNIGMTVGITTTIGIIGYIYYYGYEQIKGYAIESVLDYMKEKNNDKGFEPFRKSQSAIIHFEHSGKGSKVHIPYNRRKVVSMMRKKVYLVTDSGDEIDITHKPGVPYLLTPSDMKGKEIIVKQDDKVIKTYTSDETPMYLS
jgi:hypothetical protein